MSEPKHGRLPIDETWRLIEHLGGMSRDGVPVGEDVYTMLWWLADNGWDIVKRVPDE